MIELNQKTTDNKSAASIFASKSLVSCNPNSACGGSAMFIQVPLLII
jgi:hypothetical protein